MNITAFLAVGIIAIVTFIGFTHKTFKTQVKGTHNKIIETTTPVPTKKEEDESPTIKEEESTPTSIPNTTAPTNSTNQTSLNISDFVYPGSTQKSSSSNNL